MESKPQPNQSTLTFRIIAQVDGPFIAHLGFERVILDASRLKISTLIKVKSLSINPTDTINGGDDALVIEALCECEINKNGKAYKDYLAKRPYGGPLGYHKIDALESAIRNLMADLIRYLGWRKNVNFHYDKINIIEVRWQWEMDGESGDEKTVSKYTLGKLYEGTYAYKLQIFPNDFEEFYSLQEGLESKAIPLHQELMMEVDRLVKVYPSQLENNSRSAYLMLYSAFEVATKSLIKHWNKDITGIIDNMPSPDLNKLYVEFINVKIAEILNKEELDQLRNMTVKRNKVAHTGEAVKAETLEKYFNLVKKWIAAIEHRSGYEWAKNKEGWLPL